MHESTWRTIEEHIECGYTLMGGPVSPEEVLVAEETVGIGLDPDYAEFLRRYGAGGVGPFPIYGLRPAGLLGNGWSFVQQTISFRAALANVLPFEWYVFSDSNGNPIGQSKDHRVWAYYFDAAYEPLVSIATSFADFVERVCLKLPMNETGASSVAS